MYQLDTSNGNANIEIFWTEADVSGALVHISKTTANPLSLIGPIKYVQSSEMKHHYEKSILIYIENGFVIFAPIMFLSFSSILYLD